MNTKIIFPVLLVLTSVMCGTIQAQVYTFDTDIMQRGYYNRPYERYEAEPDYCTTNGTFLSRNDDQRTLQSEASHQQALQLIQPNDYVAWIVNQAGDGLTIRFSLPDNETGTGTTGTLQVQAGGEVVGTLSLSSYWAWQYCSDNYPVNTPDATGLIRMKYDETHLRLTRPVNSGEELRLVKTDDNTTPYTIDFVELEPVPDPVLFDELGGEKVQYDGTDIQTFINTNGGKTIYFPAGRYEYNKRLYINTNGTKLIGAGMWHTELYFSAPSDGDTYSKRGIETDRSNLVFQGFYINTINNQRYLNADDSKQVGKAFMGSWGSNSVIRDCWAEHFECGAWIADYAAVGSKNLLVEHCRFRNNYADGINCAHACEGHTVRYCSFRNNGDDDMASWTTARMCKHITYEYCTAENNWRASSLGFFGGTGHKAHHIAIFDALESGARVNADFGGKGFSTTEYITFEDITITHCGCNSGTKGTSGDFWGNRQGAFGVGGTSNYDVANIIVTRMDIVDSRGDAVCVTSGSHAVTNLQLQDISIRTAAIGIRFASAKGNATYCNITFENVSQEMTSYNSQWSWTQAAGCTQDVCNTPLTTAEGTLYDVLGRPCGTLQDAQPGEIYILHGNAVRIYQSLSPTNK